jgi:hypothetical protein
MKSVPLDRVDCAICGEDLPTRYERESARGRPRLYCGRTCRDRAQRVRELEAQAEAWERRGRPDVAEKVRRRLERDLAAWRA